MYMHVYVCAYIHTCMYACIFFPSLKELGTLDLWEKHFLMQTNILPYP